MDQKIKGFPTVNYSIKTNMLTYGFLFQESPQTTTKNGITLQRMWYNSLLGYYIVDG